MKIFLVALLRAKVRNSGNILSLDDGNINLNKPYNEILFLNERKKKC